MAQWNMLYDMYERRLKAELSEANVPAHIGVILDGNRRWAKSLGATASQGHRAGAGKISEFLQWADDAGVSIVTWKAGWPPECSQETTVATQLTGTASSTPRRRMPGIMTISTA